MASAGQRHRRQARRTGSGSARVVGRAARARPGRWCGNGPRGRHGRASFTDGCGIGRGSRISGTGVRADRDGPMRTCLRSRLEAKRCKSRAVCRGDASAICRDEIDMSALARSLHFRGQLRIALGSAQIAVPHPPACGSLARYRSIPAPDPRRLSTGRPPPASGNSGSPVGGFAAFPRSPRRAGTSARSTGPARPLRAHMAGMPFRATGRSSRTPPRKTLPRDGRSSPGGGACGPTLRCAAAAAIEGSPSANGDLARWDDRESGVSRQSQRLQHVSPRRRCANSISPAVRQFDADGTTARLGRPAYAADERARPSPCACVPAFGGAPIRFGRVPIRNPWRCANSLAVFQFAFRGGPRAISLLSIFSMSSAPSSIHSHVAGCNKHLTRNPLCTTPCRHIGRRAPEAERARVQRQAAVHPRLGPYTLVCVCKPSVSSLQSCTRASVCLCRRTLARRSRAGQTARTTSLPTSRLA